MAGCSQAEARNHEDEQALEPCQQKLNISGLSRSDDIETCNQPRHRDGKDLPPQQMRKGRPGEGTEDCKRSQSTRQPGGNGREGSWFGDRNLRPHIEEPGKVAIGLAQKSVLATVSRMCRS